MVPSRLLDVSLTVVGQTGAAGSIFWGSSSTVNCPGIQGYVRSTFGPAVLRVMADRKKCSQQQCSGNGRCNDLVLPNPDPPVHGKVWNAVGPGEAEYIAKELQRSEAIYRSLTFGQAFLGACICFPGHSGDQCELST